MFIDIHAHAYRKPLPFVCRFCTVEQLIVRYDKVGIEMGAVLPIVNPEIHLPQTNEDLLDMAAQYPDHIIQFCNIDPHTLMNSADVLLDRLLRYYCDKGCRDLSKVMPSLPVMNPIVQNLFKHAQDVGLPVIFDGSDQVVSDFGLYDEPGSPQLEHTLQRFPKLIMLGYGPVFWSEIAPLETPAERSSVFRPNGSQVGRLPTSPIKEEGVVPKLFRRYPNLDGDLFDRSPWNALAGDPEYEPKFLTEFRIVSFKMPLPMVDLLLEWHNTKKISKETFNKVARENAVKLIGL